MIHENVVAILRKLQYRIHVSRKDDPERENAVRLRDRLLEKYGLRLEDIQEARKVYVLDKLTADAARVAQHVIKNKLDIETGCGEPYNYNQYVQAHKRNQYNRSIEIALTEDEHAKLWPVLTSVLNMYGRERAKLEAKIKEEIKSRRDAFNYVFYKQAGILWPSNGESSEKDPGFSLSDAIHAAKELDGLVFPELHIKEERRMIGGPRATE